MIARSKMRRWALRAPSVRAEDGNVKISGRASADAPIADLPFGLLNPRLTEVLEAWIVLSPCGSQHTLMHMPAVRAGSFGEVMMPKFLVRATVTKEGIREVLTKAKGTGVREAVT